MYAIEVVLVARPPMPAMWIHSRDYRRSRRINSRGRLYPTLQSKYFPYAPVWIIFLANLYASALDQANPINQEVMVPLGMTLGKPIALMAIFQFLLLSLSIVPGVSTPTLQVTQGKRGLIWRSEALQDMLIILRTPSPNPPPPLSPTCRQNTLSCQTRATWTPSGWTEPWRASWACSSSESMPSFPCQEVKKRTTNSYFGRHNFQSRRKFELRSKTRHR